MLRAVVWAEVESEIMVVAEAAIHDWAEKVCRISRPSPMMKDARRGWAEISPVRPRRRADKPYFDPMGRYSSLVRDCYIEHMR